MQKSFAAFQLAESPKTQKRKKTARSKEPLVEDFLRHLNFLQHSGYVTNRGELTDTGKWASQLRIDQPLLIAEGFRRGLFPSEDPALLAAMIAPFVYEKDKDSQKTILVGEKNLIDYLELSRG